ncbi:glycosyl hydrolase-related protein [Paenibacillus sp. WQ 127069]|uniref:Glycosyl hydrolase-related protein n=1 Tax=Paenibacillus baimaensis TaxID=2982185 RepID=A0ABT2ULV8_9BACL|nr:glycoside hydrolase family 38 C-terminal domain-containing protein [Paenibacillus sp. WQ 127069]MCU6795066.1 glycosyl hydrolase-related protein [Paenibacillus sp. WQ 127069]
MIHEKQIAKTLSKLRKLDEIYTDYIFEKLDEVAVHYWETAEHRYEVPGPEKPWQPIRQGMAWGQEWSSAWFKGMYLVPDALKGQPLYVSAHTDGVEALFWVNGKPDGIFTHVKEAANRGNHHTLLLTEGSEAGTAFELAFESYAGHPCVGTQPYENYRSHDGYPNRFERLFKSIDIMQRRDDVKDFVFDLRILNQLVSSEVVDAFRKGKIVNALLEVFQVLVQSPDETEECVWRPALDKARAIMKPLLEQRNGDSAPLAGIVGHSHMDTAWLWTREETIRKCARTYANVLSLMKQYPEYTFVQSSAFHTELMRRHYPDIFEGMKQRILEGRWEPNGGVWIECDCNLVSGESLVRQFLKGQRYTREHFGYTADTFWLPDTFGYSAAIPQILAGFHIQYFLTTKLSWNDTNLFPYDTFQWTGLDGTTVLTHFNFIHCWPDAETLINRIYGTSQNKGWAIKNDIQHKQVNDRRLISYGYGDGGGGPQYEMLETARRVQDVEGSPKAEHTTVARFMKELEETAVQPPAFVGELYFEGHRGTLTQMHEIKRNNRKAELALRDLEIIEVSGWLQGQHEPSPRRDEIHEILLINQFHDILPGTSIPEVHDQAIQELKDVIIEAKELTNSYLTASVEPSPHAVTVWNTLSWARTGTFELEGIETGLIAADPSLQSQYIEDAAGRGKLLVGGVEIPALGAVVIALDQGTADSSSPFEYDGIRLETPYASLIFDDHGYISSFIDKPTGRELRGSGHPLNTFLMGEDLPGSWDNWDIDMDVNGKLAAQTNLLHRELAANGPLQLRIRSEYQIGYRSTLQQDIVFYVDSPRVDFHTIIDWKEKHQLLKVGFDVDIWSQTARHEIQFGHVERSTHTNTSYDQAMFEVCTHKWTDLSESRFGVAILNDCKYGISVDGADIRLSLHKGGCHPDPRGDEGVHEVTYSLLPHQGAFSTETVIRPAYELNIPVLSVMGKVTGQAAASLLEVKATNVIVEAIKPAEEDHAYVVRLYEAERSAVRGMKLRFGTRPSKVALINMLEEEQEELVLTDSEVSLDFHAFEIKSIKVYL